VVAWNPLSSGPSPAAPSADKPAGLQAPGRGSAPDGIAAADVGGLQKDQIVAPPKRTSSLSKIQPAAGSALEHAGDSGWSQMGSWGMGDLVGKSAAAHKPAASEAFNPFGDNPLHRALAADYRLDPVVAQPSRAPANGKMPGTAPLRPARVDSVAADAPHSMAASVRPSLPPPGRQCSQFS
jgi:hypothetical protein